MKKIAALTLILAITAACGGGGGRPSTDDVAKALKDDSNKVASRFTAVLPKKDDATIDCIAKALHDSKVSDGTLRAIVDGDEDYKGDTKDATALRGTATPIAKCVSS